MPTLENECGEFSVDEHGVLQRFFNKPDNALKNLPMPFTGIWSYENPVIACLHIPEGVAVLPDGAFKNIAVMFEISLPSSLRILDDNVFVHGIFPDVVIPKTVEKLGTFVFGRSFLKSLRLAPELRSDYGRQFKGATIGTLMISKRFRGEGDQWHKDGTILPGEESGFLRNFQANVERIQHIQWLDI